MALPQGINFRQTSAYVTDGTNESFEGTGATSMAVNYPRTTAQGNTVGWESTTGGATINPRDRKSTNDARIAGLHGISSVGTATYRIDLPSSGSYNVRLGAGDGIYSTQTKSELFDTSTSLGVLESGSTGAANSFKDAANSTYTHTNWPGSNALVSASFSTTILRLTVGNATNTCAISHFYVESGGASATSFPPVAASMMPLLAR